MAVGDPGEGIGQRAEWLDAIELAGLDQRGDNCPVLGAAIRAGEEGILSIEGDRAHGALDDVESISMRRGW